MGVVEHQQGKLPRSRDKKLYGILLNIRNGSELKRWKVLVCEPLEWRGADVETVNPAFPQCCAGSSQRNRGRTAASTELENRSWPESAYEKIQFCQRLGGLVRKRTDIVDVLELPDHASKCLQSFGDQASAVATILIQDQHAGSRISISRCAITRA